MGLKIGTFKMRWPSGLNYCYTLTSTLTNKTLIIDPATPADLTQYITPKNYQIESILNTHHHWDHSGGNAHFKPLASSGEIIGGSSTSGANVLLKDGDVFQLDKDVSIKAIHTPCHTMDSICYYVYDSSLNQSHLFTGDTLFNVGCGRFFEGSAADMVKSLKKFEDLPLDTKVYPGHEYTLSNIQFAKTVLSGEYLDNVLKLENIIKGGDGHGGLMVTTGLFTLKDEFSWNPFLLLGKGCDSFKGQDDVDVMKKLRQLKDDF